MIGHSFSREYLKNHWLVETPPFIDEETESQRNETLLKVIHLVAEAEPKTNILYLPWSQIVWNEITITRPILWIEIEIPISGKDRVLKFYPTCELTNEPVIISWILTKVMRPLGQKQKTLLLTAKAVVSFMVTCFRSPCSQVSWGQHKGPWLMPTNKMGCI